jgi:hypothetical protein
MRRLVAVAAAMLLAGFVPPGHSDNDHDQKAAGGTLPSGWTGRLDNGGPSGAGVRTMLMGAGIHFITGPAGVFYRSHDTPVSGSYDTHAMFTQLGLSDHPEGYGLFVGGSDLDGANPRYTYFLIRQDAHFLIKRRAGAATPTVTDWTESAAIRKPTASGRMANTLGIDVGKDKVRFLVNGTEVRSADPASVDTNGLAGLRINHNLSVLVEGFGVKAR